MKVWVGRCKHGKVIAAHFGDDANEIGDWLIRGLTVKSEDGPVSIGGGCEDCFPEEKTA